MRVSLALRNFVLILFHICVVRTVLGWIAGVRFRKRSLIPKGPCLVVANHNSHLDAAVLMSLFPFRRLPHVHPVAAADYFGKTWLRRTMAMLFMNAIPIERNSAPGQDPLANVQEALVAGESLIFFPEGSRGEAGVVAPFRAGVGRLVRATPGLLVVPVFLSGTERIWPRGEVVPLPLGIDVNVGKPRAYSPLADAREIADEVRRDVLALAPPPPPVPGPRPAPPVRVAVCGIEPEIRRAVFEELTARLGMIDRTVGIGETILEADALGIREARGRIAVTRSRAWPRVLAWVFRTSGLYKGSKFAEMVERARVEEALDYGRTARFVASDGSPLVDLMAWAEADFYRGVFDERGLHHLHLYLSAERRLPVRLWWSFLRKAPEVWLLNVLDLARLSPPQFLVLPIVPPAHAMERIRSRGEPIAPHENEVFLGKLQEAYRQVAEILRRGAKVEVQEFDGLSVQPAEAAEKIIVTCARILVEQGKAVAEKT